MCNSTLSFDVKSTSSAVEEGHVHPAYYLFVISKLMGGVGTAGMAALGFSYIDENSPKTKTSLYMGN
jgi:Organic Anion Transporter Polypeptide (OATP) family